MMKFYLWLHDFSEIHFLELTWEIGFGVISGNYLYFYLLENAKGL